MITKQQAIEAHEFHWGECQVLVGPRGGERQVSERWRRNGRTQTWKTRPNDWRVPIKHGLYGYGEIWHTSSSRWHTLEDCKPTRIKKGGRRRTIKRPPKPRPTRTR